MPSPQNGKSNYTQGGHVRAHMLEKCTPSSGRISSSQCWPLCMQTHTLHTTPGSVITGWDWAWNRLILFTRPELQLTHTHRNTQVGLPEWNSIVFRFSTDNWEPLTWGAKWGSKGRGKRKESKGQKEREEMDKENFKGKGWVGERNTRR